MRRWLIAVGLALGLAACAAEDAAAESLRRIGFGAHYWRTIEEMDVDDAAEDGLAWVLAYRRGLSSFVGLQGALEVLPEEYGGSDHEVFSPQALLVIGSGIYGALGVGALYSGGDLSDPFYILRAGVNIELLPSLFLDINANYMFTEFDDINDLDEDVDSDTVTLGAGVWFEL